MFNSKIYICFLWSLTGRRDKWMPCHRWIQQVPSWLKYARIFGKRQKKPNCQARGLKWKGCSVQRQKSHFFFFFLLWVFTGVLSGCSFDSSVNNRAPPHAVHNTCATTWEPKDFPNKQGRAGDLGRLVNRHMSLWSDIPFLWQHRLKRSEFVPRDADCSFSSLPTEKHFSSIINRSKWSAHWLWIAIAT